MWDFRGVLWNIYIDYICQIVNQHANCSRIWFALHNSHTFFCFKWYHSTYLKTFLEPLPFQIAKTAVFPRWLWDERPGGHQSKKATLIGSPRAIKNDRREPFLGIFTQITFWWENDSIGFDFLAKMERFIWMFPKNNGTPKSSILIGFSIIFTIHLGVSLFLETPI